MSKKKQVIKEKDDYRKLTFLIPVITSIIDVVIVASALYVSFSGAAANVKLATLLMQTATVFIAFSPTMLLLNAVLSYKHLKKHPQGSAFYIKTPMLLSVVVWGAQVLYLGTLTGA